MYNCTTVQLYNPPPGRQLYKAVGSEHYMLQTDMFYRADGELRAIAEVTAVQLYKSTIVQL